MGHWAGEQTAVVVGGEDPLPQLGEYKFLLVYLKGKGAEAERASTQGFTPQMLNNGQVSHMDCRRPGP